MDKRLQMAIDRHGGQARWERLDSVSIDLVRVGGPLPFLKGLGRTFAKPGRQLVFPHEQRAEFLGFPTAGKKGVYHRGRAGIFGAQESQYEFTLPDYRRTFSGIRKHRSWSSEDAQYFFGYAIVTYLSVPFLLAELRHEISPLRDGGFMVRAEFPPAFHSHNPLQTFYFDPEGLLFRHDYVAEVVGGLAYGAHFTSAYVEMDGMAFATRREVFVRLGSVVTPLPVLNAELRLLAIGWRSS
jgi:hypothetical protein